MTQLNTAFNLPLDADPNLRRALQRVLTEIVEQINVGAHLTVETITADSILGVPINLVDATAATRVCTLVPALDWEDRVLYVRARGGVALLTPQSGETIDGVTSLSVPASSSRAVISDGSNWHSVSAAESNQVNRGFSLTNNGTDADHDIDVGAGSCWDSTETFYFSVGALTKQFDTLWAVGSAAGALDAGAIPADDILHIYAIRKDGDGSGDIVCSTAGTWAGVDKTRLSGYTYGRHIGAVATDATNNIYGFKEREGVVIFNHAQTGAASSSLTKNTLASQTIACVPPGAIVYGTARLGVSTFQSRVEVAVGSHEDAGGAVTECRVSSVTMSSAVISTAAGGFAVPVNGSQQLSMGMDYTGAAGTETLTLYVTGYGQYDRFAE